MPRDPKDTSVTSNERIQRRLAEARDIGEPAFRRSGSGASGAEGKEGKPGATWYSGTTVPSTGLGAVGDFYLRTTTSDVYKKTGEAAWSLEVNIKGTTGTAGTNGTNGATWYSGTTAPAEGLGVNSDFYFRTTTDDVYKKEAGTWSIIANLKGSTGETGASGKEGPAGSASNNDWKNSVRAATTANITISTALNPADVLDGVTLAENDRVLVKNQTTKSENGIWVVKAVPVRAEDADAAAELSGGSTIYVEEGTRNKRRTFQIITAGNITPGTTAHEYQQLGVRDFGIVEALPSTEALKGDLCTFKAAAGIYWQLLYTDVIGGEETRPWAKIGGPPLHTFSNVERSLTSEAYASLPTDPLKITVPLKGDYDIEISAWMKPINVVEGNCRLSYAVGATAAADEWCLLDQVVVGEKNENLTLSKKHRFESVAASAVIEEKGKSSFAGASIYKFRHLWVDPVRVG